MGLDLLFTIYLLLKDYVKTEKQKDVDAFTQWLVMKGHKDLRDLISKSSELNTGLASLLNRNDQEILDKLDILFKQLAQIASRIDGISEIHKAVIQSAPDQYLSAQAFGILKAFESTGAEYVTEAQSYTGDEYLVPSVEYLLPRNGPLPMLEPQLMASDIQQLLDLGLLLEDHDPQGARRLRPMRAGIELAKQGKVTSE